MKFSWLWLLLLAGCVGDERETQRLLRDMQPVDPPPFLNAELARAFGTADFSARVEVTTGPRLEVGELFGHAGSLFYSAGSVGALWDAASQKTYLFNDPLQGYAPITETSTNIVVLAVGKEGLPELIKVSGPRQEATLRVSRVQIKNQSAEMFLLPSGFKRYESLPLMFGELARRRGEAIDARSRARRAKFGDPGDDLPQAPRPGRY